MLHRFVEFVFDQTVPTWLALRERALVFFGGVPSRLVIDNLKAGITRAAWDDPEVQAAYRECAEHYGFLIAPCRPRTPEHKGKSDILSLLPSHCTPFRFICLYRI
jgi:transposase